MSYPVFISRLSGKLVSTPPPCHACPGICCSVDAGYKFVQLSYTEQQNPIFRKVLTTHKPTGSKGFWFTQAERGQGRLLPFLQYR